MKETIEEMTPDEQLDNAFSNDEFPYQEYCYYHCMGDQDGMDAIKVKFQARKARCDDYKAQVAAAKDDVAVQRILASITLEAS